VRSCPIREEHGFVYIWWGDPCEMYPPVPWFESVDDDMVYTTLRDHWANHYARAIENQLDVVHLPFIHHNTIGRGNGPWSTDQSPEKRVIGQATT